MRIGVLHQRSAAATLRQLFRSRGAFQIVILIPGSEAEAAPELVRACSRLFETVILGDRTSVARSLSTLDLAGLCTFVDSLVELRDDLVQQLNLPRYTHRPGVWDKLCQRKMLRTAGLCSIEAHQVDSWDDLTRGVDDLGTPGVLKPRRGSRSTGLQFIDSPEQCMDMATDVQPRQHLYEQRITDAAALGPGRGNYVSVESVVGRGQVEHVAFVDKYPLSIESSSRSAHSVRETGDIMPSAMSPAQLERCASTTSAAIEVLEIQNGVVHTELMFSAHSVQVVEVNGRLGGEIATLVSMLSPDTDLVCMCLAAAAGTPLSAAQVSSPQTCVASIYVPFASRVGMVRSDVAVTSFVDAPGVESVLQVAKKGMTYEEADFTSVKVLLRCQTAAELLDAAVMLVARATTAFAAEYAGSNEWAESVSRCRVGRASAQ
jgi:hypothetical protein